jgi:threonine dehydrogenase-like Zn-dependent dehydrogenase
VGTCSTDHARGTGGGLGIAQEAAGSHFLDQVLLARRKGGAVHVVAVEAQQPRALESLAVGTAVSRRVCARSARHETYASRTALGSTLGGEESRSVTLCRSSPTRIITA